MEVKNKPALYSILSGCVWAMIGYLVAYSVAPIRSSAAEVGQMFLGGVLAAPFIGLLIGVISRRFTSLGRSGVLPSLWRICTFLPGCSSLRQESHDCSWSSAG